MNQEKNLVLIARVTSSHGIKGELNVQLFNPESETLHNNSKIYILKKGEKDFVKFDIEKIRYGNKIILKLQNINSRIESDSIIPFEIYVPRGEFPELDEDEYYIEDLIYFNVIDFESNKLIGVVEEYYDTPANTVIVVKTGCKKIDVIFNKNFIKEVDLNNRSISIIVPIEVE